MSSTVQNGSGPVAAAPEEEHTDNPLHWLTEEQIEAIGKEFEELHEQMLTLTPAGEAQARARGKRAFQRCCGDLRGRFFEVHHT